MDKNVATILDLSSNQVDAEKALLFICEKFKLYGANDIVVKMINSWVNFICDNFDNATTFCLAKMAYKNLGVDFLTALSTETHKKLSPNVQSYLSQKNDGTSEKVNFSYDDYKNKDTISERWIKDEFGLKFK